MKKLLLGCGLLLVSCLATATLAWLKLDDFSIDDLLEDSAQNEPEVALPATLAEAVAWGVDAGYEFEKGEADLWWGWTHSIPEDDLSERPADVVAAEKQAKQLFDVMERLGAGPVQSGLGPRPVITLDGGARLTEHFVAHNQGGAARGVVMTFEGPALDAGTVRISHVTARNGLTSAELVGDGGVFVFDSFALAPHFDTDLGSRGPASVLRSASEVLFDVEFEGLAPGTGALEVWVQPMGVASGVTGKGRLQRRQVSVTR